ncbi:hypothetical protein [Eubacterium pyruvativorans]|uniref:hypothetical protein n=1 Tax=Eubacterium pyruvativorans TaxID=155865 RepID=UPI0015636BAD
MPEAARCLSQRERNSVSNGRKRLWAIAEQNEFVNVIDKKRLRGKYIGEDGKRIKPEKQKKLLGFLALTNSSFMTDTTMQPASLT